MRTIKIGRNPDNDIVVSDSSFRVSRYHALLKVYDNGTIGVIDHSSNGTYVNGVKIKSNIETVVSITDRIVFAGVQELDWSQISKSFVLIPTDKPADISFESENRSYFETPQGSNSKKSSTRKVIGWILVFIAVVGIFSTGISFTFEGLCAVFAPIIGGVILIISANE